MAEGREELASSVRLAVTDEARLFGGGLLALAVYALWLGLSGAALTFGANALDVSLAPRPWTGGKTGLAAVALVAWVLVPAAVGAGLLVSQLTNRSGNIAQRYRYRYPAALLVPPAVLLAAAAAVTVALTRPPWPVFVVLVLAALFLLVRTIAYSYRVFSLSVPWALWVAAGLSLLALSVALLTGGAAVAGRDGFLVAVTEAFAGRLGVNGAVWLVNGRVPVAGVTLPAAVAVAVAVPAGLSVLYLLVQTLAGVVNRLRKPDVPRSELRTGQRHPDFVRPTTARAGDTTGSGPGAPGIATSSGGSGGSGGSVSGAGSGATAGSTTGSTSSASNSGSGSPGSPAGSQPDSADPGDGRTEDNPKDSPTVDTGPTDPQVTEEVSNTRVYTPPDDGDSDPSSFGADSTGSGDTTDHSCPECGHSYDPGAGFCSACGAALD